MGRLLVLAPHLPACCSKGHVYSAPGRTPSRVMTRAVKVAGTRTRCRRPPTGAPPRGTFRTYAQPRRSGDLEELTINNEVQLISDGEGLAVIGDPTVVEQFLASEGLLATRELELPSLSGLLSAGATAAQAASGITANSGRWVKLTQESAALVTKHGLRENAKTGLLTGVVKGSKGQVKTFVEFAKGPGTLLTNPALLAGAAGVMAQVAMRQTMDEITDYLATIDEKVDDVLRAQKDDVLARMIGAGLMIEETMTLREHGGRVNEVTWSKIQTAPTTIAETQAYALRQLDALADKLEAKTKIGDLADAAKQAELKAKEWLAVLARCCQLQDAVAVIELDRVLYSAPDELDGHRLGLRAARRDRMELLARTTQVLVARMDQAAALANTKVLLHPARSPEVVRASNHVGTAVGEFRQRLGIDDDRRSVEARRWAGAAAEVRSKVLETGGDGVDVARRLGSGTLRTAESVKGGVSRRVVARTRLRRRATEGDPQDD